MALGAIRGARIIANLNWRNDIKSQDLQILDKVGLYLKKEIRESFLCLSYKELDLNIFLYHINPFYRLESTILTIFFIVLTALK